MPFWGLYQASLLVEEYDEPKASHILPPPNVPDYVVPQKRHEPDFVFIIPDITLNHTAHILLHVLSHCDVISTELYFIKFKMVDLINSFNCNLTLAYPSLGV